jgi:citrate synthase
VSGTRYLTAREAAGELGISLKTLYAYVSRGLIRSEAVGGKRRNRRYRAEDVRKLKERKEQRRDPFRATAGPRRRSRTPRRPR